MKTKSTFSVYQLTYLAIMTAFVIILQLAGSFIHLGGQFSVSLVLIPIVLGSIVGGPLGGLWLGIVFGATVLASGDAALFLGINPFGTVVTVLLKGALAGLCAGFVYKLLEKVNTYLAVAVAAVVCPLVNTGIFALGSYVFFLDAIKEWASAESLSATVFIFTVLIGLNFIFELIFNIVLCPIIHRLIKLIPNKNNR